MSGRVKGLTSVLAGLTIHDLLSRKLLLPLTRAQRLARASRRPAMRAFYEGMRFRRQSAAWNEEQRREWMLKRLRYIVRRAAVETVFYRELFARVGFDPQVDFSFADFARLPVLEREEIRRAGRALISNNIPADQLRKDSTGGSTGEPTHVWLGPEELGWRESALEYPMQKIGAPTGTPTGYLWGHHLDPVARETWRERYHDFESNVRWFDCFRLSAETLARYHTEFTRWRPRCIIAYASALAALAEYVLAENLQPNYPSKCFVTGAEKLLPAQRDVIERAFPTRPVHERYGSRDVGIMGFQIEPSRTHDFEVDWQNVLVEPETTEAESSILVTKLHADAMPMLRYRVGDVGRFPAERREPGQPSFVLHEVLGREADRIWLPDGRWITGLQMPHMLKDYPVREFMFLQRPDYSVELQVIPQNNFGEDSRRSILETVEANLPGLRVSLALVQSIPRTKANKLRPVVSEVKRTEANEGNGR
jgi:phenylacetate-CoA ligase